ncbi:MAG TPA: hypothetical protein VFR61_02000 [Nitrososphaeraceae archaeon]|nr:hypothetical protein [Nitrososphaeraceae archaeon]
MIQPRGLGKLNISEEEAPYDIVAKTCECENRRRKVTYSMIDTCHSLCHDKKDLILGQIEACQRLVKYIAKDGRDEIHRQAILSEIDELKMILDLIQ